jgi:hypothetical protein
MRLGQVTSNLLFHPIANERETPTRMTHRKVLHPTLQHRIECIDQSLEGSRAMASKHLFELAKQRRTLLVQGSSQGHPLASLRPNAPKRKP